MAAVILFITVYGILTFGKDKKQELDPGRIPMPDLEENQTTYGTKLEAIEAIKEERAITAPQIYPDHMVDDKGFFNPDYMEYEKQRIIDSICGSNDLKYDGPMVMAHDMPLTDQDVKVVQEDETKETSEIPAQELGLGHQLFFASNPKNQMEKTNQVWWVRVDGTQTVKDGHRLALRLDKEAHINGEVLPRNTQLFGFVKIRSNRVLLDIAWQKSKLVAHDLQDGREGIYIENRLLGEVRTNTVDGMIGQVNLPGFPKISGIRRIFQRDNQRVKVTLLDNYQMTLKPEQ